MSTIPHRALFTADLQLCNSLPYSRVVEHGETDRLRDQLQVIEAIGNAATELEVDAIYVLGDIFERRLLDVITLVAGIRAINRLALIAPVYLLPGNHDANSAKGERFLPEAFGEMKLENIRYLDGSEKLSFNVGGAGPRGHFRPVPWGPLEETRKRIAYWREKCRDDPGFTEVLLLHQSINGCKDGGWTCEGMLDADEVCQGFDLVLAGDFHEPQEFGTCGRYVGSPMQHDFRDAGSGPRGVLFVEFAKNLVQRFIPIESPRFHVQKITRDSRALSNPLPRRGDYLRIDVEATHAEWLTSLPEIEQYAQELVAKGVNVLPPKHVPIAQVETRLGKNAPDFLEAASAYVKLANTEGLDPDRLIQIAQEVLNEVENG